MAVSPRSNGAALPLRSGGLVALLAVGLVGPRPATGRARPGRERQVAPLDTEAEARRTRRLARRAAQRFGFIDATGRFVIPPRFLDARSFGEGRAAVCVPASARQASTGECRWGFVDRTGRLVVPATWDAVRSFSGGRAAVCRRAEGRACRWGLVDPRGRVVLAPVHQEIRSFRGDRAAFARAGRWGFLGPDGREEIPRTGWMEPPGVQGRLSRASPMSSGNSVTHVSGLDPILLHS